jgi:hypothetical protein
MSDGFWTSILFDGVVLSVALGIVVLGSLGYNPRLWLQDAPPRARALATPLTNAERRVRLVVGILFFTTLAGVTVWSAARLLARHGETLSFGAVFSHFLGVFLVFNLFDLLVVDWLILLAFRPEFLTRLSVPGLSYEEIVGSYSYHFRAFIRGVGLIVVVSLIVGSLTYLLR